jgi:hypothetical protein
VSGWISGNAPCCIHHGETADTRGRGGFIFNGNGAVNYHCFNCGYKTGYTPGQHLSYRFRKLLVWLGIDENLLKVLIFEAFRLKDSVDSSLGEEKEPLEFKSYNLPGDAVNICESEDIQALEYLATRSINLSKYEFYVSKIVENNLNRRIIIPCYWQGKIVGYTARSWDPAVKKKYYAQYDKKFVFNLDTQAKNWKFVIVCEGPFDAMSIDGVAILGNSISEEQANIIDSLGREVIVVPDFDIKRNKKWPGENLIEQAKEYSWTVSFPVWQETCKDVNEAVAKYGKLFALQSILAARVHSSLKIEIMKRKLLVNS